MKENPVTNLSLSYIQESLNLSEDRLEPYLKSLEYFQKFWNFSIEETDALIEATDFSPDALVTPCESNAFKGVPHETYQVLLGNKEYAAAVLHSFKMWSSTKKGSTFNRGCMNSDEDPRRVERIGTLGEIAFAAFIKQPANVAYKRHGHKADFVINDRLVDVKTSMPEGRRPKTKGYVRSVSARGFTYKLKNDIYVLAQAEEDDRKHGKALIRLIGYFNKETVESLPDKPGMGGHLNKELLFTESLPLKELYESSRL